MVEKYDSVVACGAKTTLRTYMHMLMFYIRFHVFRIQMYSHGYMRVIICLHPKKRLNATDDTYVVNEVLQNVVVYVRRPAVLF